MKKALCMFLSLALCAPLLSCAKSIAPVENEAVATETKEEQQATDKTSTPVKEEEKEDNVPDPDADDVIRILMIGNSFCYYFPDELYGMMKAAGMNIEITNLYYSGCKLHQHWEWYLDNAANYQYITTTGSTSEYRTVKKDYTLRRCLDSEAWDIITIQQHFSPTVAETYESSYKLCTPYGEKLMNMLRKAHPKADFYFQETWAYQVGWERDGVVIKDSAMQQNHQNNITAACKQLCEELQLEMIPSGSAWNIARNDSRIGDVLCNKGPNGDDSKGDRYHEGTTGGGQYLNACVWFEVLTGQSCIGNSFRPTEYDLDETRAQLLQQIAHQAVAER